MGKKPASPVMLLAGTRPEAIKLAPLYKELRAKNVPTLFCALGQHEELLSQALRCFKIEPDFVCRIMKPNQDLFHITSRTLLEAKKILKKIKPSVAVVQGDTTTALASSLAAFYLQIPVAHVEAGLRTSTIQSPFPEELNRRCITLLSSLHFAPTAKCTKLLQKEGVPKETIFCTGNTIVDALFSVCKAIERGEISVSKELFETTAKQKNLQRKLLLLTAHRRESFGGGLISIFQAVRRALQERNDLFVLFPMHPNPLIREAFEKSGLAFAANLLLLPPLSYSDLIFALDAADFVATDSGGLQEEAVSLNKPILVLRKETDRPEACCFLAGTNEEKILFAIRRMMAGAFRSHQCMPYGDGLASQRIALVLQSLWESQIR